MADEIQDIADDGSNDYMTIVKGDESYNVVNHEAINRSRLRVDSRKWIASKLLPKKYGDKQVDVSVNPIVQINIVAPQVEPRHNPADLKPEFDVIEGK